MPFVGSEVFGGIAADEPGEPGQDCSDDVLDDCDHELLLGSKLVTILWLHDVEM